MAWIINQGQTRNLIDMPVALKVVEQIFRDRAAGKVRSLPRRRLKGSAKQLNMMAAWQSDSDLLCLRAYAGGANTITLYNGRRGEIRAVLSGAYLSSLRTGAASGVAAKFLAPSGSRVMGLVGPGWQATFQLKAIIKACRIKKVLVFGRNEKRRKAFLKKMRGVTPAELLEVSSIREIERDSDIIVLATDSNDPLMNGKGVKDECLVITMGANQPTKHEVSLDLIRRMDLVVTDDLPTAQLDSGDLISACKAGVLKWKDVVPLERMVARRGPKKLPGRILFQSNGIADEDLAVGRYVLNRAMHQKLRLKKIPEI